MDIINFKSGGQYPISYPFEAIVDLMGDDGILDYLSKYNSIRHQIKVLHIGLKYGSIQSGKIFTMPEKEAKVLAQNNPRQLKEAFKMYDAELAIFLKIYFSETEGSEEDKTELTPEEIKENEERVKHLVSDLSGVSS